MNYLPARLSGFGLISDNAKTHSKRTEFSAEFSTTITSSSDELSRLSSLRSSRLPLINGKDDIDKDKDKKHKEDKLGRGSDHGKNSNFDTLGGRKRHKSQKSKLKENKRKVIKNHNSRWTATVTKGEEVLVKPTPLSPPRRSCSKTLFVPSTHLSKPRRSSSNFLRYSISSNSNINVNDKEDLATTPSFSSKNKIRDLQLPQIDRRGKNDDDDDTATEDWITKKKKMPNDAKVDQYLFPATKLSVEKDAPPHEACRWGDGAPRHPRRHYMIPIENQSTNDHPAITAEGGRAAKKELESRLYHQRCQPMVTVKPPTLPSRQLSNRIPRKKSETSSVFLPTNSTPYLNLYCSSCSIDKLVLDDGCNSNGNDDNAMDKNNTNNRNNHNSNHHHKYQPSKKVKELLDSSSLNLDHFVMTTRGQRPQKQNSSITLDPLESSCRSSITFDTELNDFSEFSISKQPSHYSCHNANHLNSLLGEIDQ